MAPTTPAPSRPHAAGRDWLKIVLVELAGFLALGFLWVLWQVVAPIAHTVVLFLLGAALDRTNSWTALPRGGTTCSVFRWRAGAPARR